MIISNRKSASGVVGALWHVLFCLRLMESQLLVLLVFGQLLIVILEQADPNSKNRPVQRVRILLLLRHAANALASG